MKANPEKFQALSIGNKTFSTWIVLIYLDSIFNFFFNLDSINIKCEEEVKLLGVTIDSKLKFNKRIAIICKKAARQLNVLKHIGKHLTKLGKLTIYYSFIMSDFNYCPVVWQSCGENNTRKIENPRKGSQIYL